MGSIKADLIIRPNKINVWLSSTDRPKLSARSKSILLIFFFICPLNKTPVVVFMKKQIMCGDILILNTNKTVPFDFSNRHLFIFAFICCFSHHSSCKKRRSSDRPTLPFQPSKERRRTTKRFFLPVLSVRKLYWPIQHNWQFWGINLDKTLNLRVGR